MSGQLTYEVRCGTYIWGHQFDRGFQRHCVALPAVIPVRNPLLSGYERARELVSGALCVPQCKEDHVADSRSGDTEPSSVARCHKIKPTSKTTCERVSKHDIFERHSIAAGLSAFRSATCTATSCTTSSLARSRSAVNALQTSTHPTKKIIQVHATGVGGAVWTAWSLR